MKYVAPLSPHGLIQEHYPGDEYRVLVCCQLLNQTSRKRLEAKPEDRALNHYRSWHMREVYLKNAT